MSRQDPLELLRSAFNTKTQKKASLKQKGNDLIFDRDTKLSLFTETAWKSTTTNKQFNLGSLWLFLDHNMDQNGSKSDYYKKIVELKLEPVGAADSQEIIKYFSGEINESDCIDKEIKLALAEKDKNRDGPVSGLEDGIDKPSKKVKTEKIDDAESNLIKVIEYLSSFEKPMNSKSRCLRFPQKKFTNILTHLIENQNTTVQKPEEQSQGGKARIATIYEQKRVPFIIVPGETIPGNVSIENIEQFLVRGEYDEYAKLSNSDISKLDIERQMKGKHLIFEINSRPELLSEKDWQYVVAIFVLGRDNEFDLWPIKDQKKIFENSLGYMIKFPKTLTGRASNWKCSIKTLDPVSRILDKDIVRSIWQEIENFVFQRV